MVYVFVMVLFIFYVLISVFLFFFKQKTAYEMRISDWSSDVCSSDLQIGPRLGLHPCRNFLRAQFKKEISHHSSPARGGGPSAGRWRGAAANATMPSTTASASCRISAAATRRTR